MIGVLDLFENKKLFREAFCNHTAESMPGKHIQALMPAPLCMKNVINKCIHILYTTARS